MPGLTIDWMLLESAFESHAPDQRAFLDRKSGEIKFFVDGEDRGDVDEAAAAGHFVRVEPIPSREQYRMMERFIATVENVPLKAALQDAIVGKGAFRRFKDAVGRHPDERKRWFAFRDALLHRYILEWLKTHKLELQEIPAWNLEPPMTPLPESSTSPLLSAEGAAIVDDAPVAVAVDRADLESLRAYVQAWARSHGEEYRYLFGPAAFERLAFDMSQEFIIHRKRSS